MRVLLTLCLVICASVGVESICSSVCVDLCNKFLDMCSGNYIMKKAGISCQSLSVQCNSTCNDVYCTCIENNTKVCQALRDDCTDSADSREASCDPVFTTCLVSEIVNCGQRLANIIMSVAGSAVSDILPHIPYVADLFKNGGIAQLWPSDVFDQP